MGLVSILNDATFAGFLATKRWKPVWPDGQSNKPATTSSVEPEPGAGPGDKKPRCPPVLDGMGSVKKGFLTEHRQIEGC